MKRRPEPELMDSAEQTAAYAAADFNESNTLFAHHFTATFPDLPGTGRIVDLGCGPGDIAVRMAHALPGWQVTGMDAGENMLKRAAARLAQESGRLDVTFRLAYLPDDSLEPRAWDALISNSLLHHLPEPRVLWDSIARLGRPGAAVQVMDLARPDDETAARQMVEQYSGDEPEVLREDFYNSLLAAYTVAEVREQLARAGLVRLNVDMASDRHWIASGHLEG